VLREPKLAPRVALGFPRGADEARLARAQACLLGLVIGSLAPEGGLSGDVELALALARAIAREKHFDAPAALAVQRDWLDSRAADGDLPASALLRAVPIGVQAAGNPARAARAAREDASLAQSDSGIVEASASMAAAIAAGIAGGSLADMLAAARAQCIGARHEAIERALSLLRAGQDFEQVLAGAAGEQRALAGALFGALHGRAAIPRRDLLRVLAWRPGVESGVPQPRPMAYWPDDLLELAEALIAP
jgi:ADP-ribosylglycohydrolase